MEKKYYGALNGLRMIAALGIVLFHIKATTEYQITGYAYEKVITSFSNFVFLFMIISAFSMCCGYYDKILNNQLSFSKFYSKRFKKILPFYSIIVLLEIITSPSIASLYEGFADFTLLFGFLPDTLSFSVVGVGWFLGLIFVFYLVFPFFCVLLENKRRAWIAFAISLIYNFACINYFHVGKSNILYSACFFLAGGLIYLYRDKIEKINQWLALLFVVVSIVSYYVFGRNIYLCLLVCITLLIYAVTTKGKILNNSVTKFFSNISLEIYLSHMAMFRIIEKINLVYLFGDGWLQYAITSIIVFCCATAFAFVMHKLIEFVICKTENFRLRKQNN